MSGKAGGGKGRQSGGVNISGKVGSVGGDIVGRDKTVGTSSGPALETTLRPLSEAIGAAPAEKRAEAEAKPAALKQEAAKGEKASTPRWPSSWTGWWGWCQPQPVPW
jgi:hypothetical protein